MCETLSELRASSTDLLARFDPALLPVSSLRQVIEDASSIEKMMGTLSTLAASRLAKTGPAKTSRQHAARELAKRSGGSLKQAERALDAADTITSHPYLEAAARGGELSRPQLSLIAGAAKSNPGAIEGLLDLARTGSLGELAAGAARARAIGEDMEARQQQIHARRSLRTWTSEDGAWHLHAQGRPEDGAKVMAAIKPLADQAFEAARREGKRDPQEAYAFDGLVGLACAGDGGTPASEVLVRVDIDVLLRGYALGGDTCEVAGVGPVSAQAVYDIMRSGSAFLKGIVTRGQDVAGVVHFGRRATSHQKSALDWLFPTCAAEGCGTRAAFCETDHRLDWAKSHITLLDLLDRLCRFHHGLKTYQGWALVEGRGNRAFVAPDDPRHPRFGPGPPEEARP